MPTPNRYTTVLIASLLALSAATLWGVSQRNEQAEMLLEQAQQKELVDGRLEEAITIYRDVLARFPKNRAASAKALVQMGQCYEKLGRDEARKAYERVLQDYADQGTAAEQARTRLAALRKPAGSESGVVTRKLWSGRYVDIEGAVSSDGRHFSYTDWETEDLAVRDLETGKSRRLTNKGSSEESSEGAEYSAISPDGRQIAYGWFNKDDFGELRLIGIDGSKPRVLYGNRHLDVIQPAAWSPDGKQILATFYGKDVTSKIVLVSVADGSVRVLKELGWRMPLKPAISPDGRYIAYDSCPQEGAVNRDIYLLSLDGKQETALIEHPANELSPVWTPDGRHILFASDRTGSMSFWIIQVAEGKAQGAAVLVKRDVGQRILPIGFTREGSLYYGLETGMMDIYTASLDFKTGKLLAAPTKATERFVGSNSWPDWSSDGRYLAYVSQRGPMWEGSFVVCIRSLKTGEERDLAPKLSYIFFPRWSPDGRSILLSARDAKNRWGLYVMDVNSGNVTPVVQNREGVQVGWAGPRWSTDGKVVFYVRRERGSEQASVVARELETGQEKEVYRAPAGALFAHGSSISPDGKWVVFRSFDPKAGVAALEAVPSGGGASHELFRLEKGGDVPGFTPLEFTPDALQLLFSKGGSYWHDGKSELWRVSLEGGIPQRLELAMDGLRNLRIHPDGQRVAFSAGQLTNAEIWVMENFLPK